MNPRESCHQILKRHADALGLSIKTEWKRKDGSYCFCFHISGARPCCSDKWFCFSIVMTVPEFKLGVWTRGSIGDNKSPFDVVDADRTFDPNSFDQWLETWFKNDALKELNRS